jgi:uncharacterized protein DUF3499
MRCGSEAVATISLRYADRDVVVTALVSEPDPSLLELCREHVDRMTLPVGWTRRDEPAASLVPR